MSGRSKVGYPSSYEGGDQRHYSRDELHEEGRMHGVNIEGYLNKESIMNELQESDNKRQIEDRMKHEPGFAATMHGNKPSRGAQVDAEIAREEAEQLAKKADKTDSMPGKKLEHNTDKSEWKLQMEQEEKEARAKHSKRGTNKHEGQGMEYVSRKNDSSRD
ncbi:hypothetical protein F53441_7865 [Fusarium austroafricanum]|uniref:Uncharacterized protein n=1 Tax=Fusarium austroafricanum TaxID=2364996 RepID=A0A8H4NX43_9HYPO|nr:hypothetical protein F53441_7865 [Fusarium austroafricanum]